MVVFFRCSDERFVVYMGKDKYENEKLLEYGFPEDIWFHVDKFSSAHVYLRLPMDIWRDLMKKAYPPHGIPSKSQAGIKSLTEADYREYIPEGIIKEMCVLVKGNSIDGSKAAKVDVCWTPFANLKKEAGMDVGSVYFHDENRRWLSKNVEKENEILKPLEKTRSEREVDLAEEKTRREQEEIAYRKKLVSQMKEAERLDNRRLEEERQQKSYDRLNDEEKKQSNHLGPNYAGTVEEARQMEDDFM